MYSTYYGGSGDDFGRGIVLDNNSNPLIVGTTSSTDLQVVSAVQSSNAGGTDVFVTKVSETIAPTAPPNLRSTGKTETSISLAWDTATDNVGVIGYEVYIFINGENYWRYAGWTTSTTYTVTGRSPNSLYYFYVTARDAGSNVSSASNVISVTTNADTLAPSVPANLRSTGKTEKTVSLAWDAAIDNVGVASYEIYKGTTLAGTSTTTTFTVSSLSPSTSYSFTVKAKDASGNVSAASTAVTVTTNADTTPPSTPTNFRSTGTTATTINLAWDAATDNIGVAGYDIYWYEATSSGTIQRFLGSTTGTTFTVTGRSPNTTYSLGVSAKDAAGNYSPSSTRISVTTAADTQAPTVPANLRSTGTTETTTSLAWDTATDNVGVTSYYIYKGTQFTGSSATTSFTVTGLTPNTNTTFTVRAVDAVGNLSGASNAVTATTRADTQAPTTPPNLRSTGATATTISLAWDAATDNVGVTGYEVYNGVTLVATVTGRTYMVTGLAPNTSYTFTVKAKDGAGNRSGASAALTEATTADTQAPSVPTNLRTTGTTEQTVDLAWDASTDNVAVTEYNVYRGGVLIGTTTTQTYAVSGLTPATSYTFTVRAKDGAGNVSAESSPLTISTNADTQAPTTPTNLRSTGQTATTVALAWDAATDNIGVTEYEVYDGSTRVGTTATTSFTVDPLSAGTTYTFTVKAKDGAGNVSAASNALTVTPVDTLPPSAPTNVRSTTTTAMSIALAWDAATDNVGVTGYEVYNGSTLAGTTTGTTYTLSGLTPSTSYSITVKVRDAANNVSASSSALTVTTTADTEAPTSPTYFTWTAKTEASISFAWEPATDNVGVTTYELFYGTSSTDITTSGGTTSTTTYTVTGLKPRTAYYFKIVARDAAGNVSPPTTYGSYIFTPSDTTPPTSPTNLRTTHTTETSIGLAWDAATDAVGVTGYDVYNDGVLVGTTTNTAFTVTSLTPNTTYSFTVTAKDMYRNLSEPSTALSATTNPDITPPSTPTNVRTTSSDTSVSLVWDAASDNIGVTGYDVYYGTTLAGTTTNTFVTVGNLTPNTSYTFTVKATDAAGNHSGASEAVTITTTSGAMPETRTIRYTYDGLARLTDAVEDPGTAYKYTYDLSGNRTEVKVNGVLTESRSYNAANQVVGWQYDAVGNLLSDGTAARSYTYDALRRLTTATTNGTAVTSTYNGDGTLVAQTTGTATTRFTQDLAQPLVQVLQETQGGITTNHVYGYERLVSLSGMTQQWYGTDGLGSVRQTLDASGQPLSALHYDPWGTPQGATAPATFGFTSEVQDSTSGLVNLRARWYQPETGTFLTRDSYPGVNGVPASRHPYQYALNAPTQYTDPSGNCPWCIAVAGGAAISAGIEYGSQVYGNYQNGMSGSAAWTSVDGRALGQAALQGAIEGGVGFVGGPWLGRALGKGWKAAMAAGAIEGALSGILSQLGFNWYNGCNWGNGLGGAALRGAGIGGAFGAVGYGAQKAFARAKPMARLGVHSPDVPRASGLADDVDTGVSAIGGSCKNSFSANTVVATKEGEEPISEVELGEQVLAWDETTGQTGYYTVTATISHIDPVIVRLTLDDEEIETTPEHPFYTEERGWVDAAKLTVGEHVRQSDGELGVVTVVRLEQRTQRMYNLTVAVAHTFFVGDEQWLVHNTNCPEVAEALTAGLPYRKDGKGPTSGYLFDKDGNRIGDLIVSGRTKSLPYIERDMIRDSERQLDEFPHYMSMQDHVEMKVARYMHEHNMTEATLVINNHPCKGGKLTCDIWLKYAIPLNARLRVIVPDGYDVDGVFDEPFKGE